MNKRKLVKLSNAALLDELDFVQEKIENRLRCEDYRNRVYPVVRLRANRDRIITIIHGRMDD
jgi:hypothetical protein